MRTLLLFALLAVSLAAAQAPSTGTIAGTVRDVAGKALPGVTVTVVGPDGAAAATVVTDAKGVYTLAVPAGTYTVGAELPGFSSQLRVDVTVASASRIDVPFTLAAAPVQPDPNPFRRSAGIDITADSLSRQGTIVQYRGNVRMRTSGTDVMADEVDFDTNTRIGDARGNVRIRVLTPEFGVVPLSQR
jgi:hypothetical protein